MLATITESIKTIHNSTQINDIDNLLFDSYRNKKQIIESFSLLPNYLVKKFFQIRINQKYDHIFQFQGNYNSDELFKLMESKIWKKIFSTVNGKFYLIIHEAKDKTYGLKSSGYIFSFKREYPDFYDIFSFEVSEEYLNISNQKQLLLMEQLSSVISLITISTTLGNKITPAKVLWSANDAKKLAEKKLVEQYNITLSEYRYLQAISLGGSSK